MCRFRSFARRIAYGQSIEGPYAAGRQLCPFYCLRNLQIRNCNLSNAMLTDVRG